MIPRNRGSEEHEQIANGKSKISRSDYLDKRRDESVRRQEGREVKESRAKSGLWVGHVSLSGETLPRQTVRGCERKQALAKSPEESAIPWVLQQAAARDRSPEHG